MDSHFAFTKAAYSEIIVKGNKGVDVVAWLNVGGFREEWQYRATKDRGRGACHRTGRPERNDNR